MEQENVIPLEFKAGVSIAHEVDPVLAAVVYAVNEKRLPEQDVWISLSGNFIYGHLISFDDGFASFFNVEQGTEFQKRDPEQHLPTYSFLRDAVMMDPSGNVVNAPVVRVKLAHVSAWGFGTPH